MPITTNEIRNLERKYMDELWNWVSGNEFLSDIKELETNIKNQYSRLTDLYQIKNKVQLAAERLLHFYVHKKMNVVEIYSSPLSSDIAFYTPDALINIDSKTIDLDGNKGDDNYIQFGFHQVSFSNRTFFGRNIKGQTFSGIDFKQCLPEIDPDKNVPCLTFFLKITYKDDRNNFDISHISLSCVPNGEIAKKDFNNDLIQNFKTYHYLKEQAAKHFGGSYSPKPVNKFQVPSSWIPFNLKNGDGANDSWLDINLKNPFVSGQGVIWRVLDKKYHVCLGGHTARINPEKVRHRKDGLSQDWLGVREQSI